jgi:hypothetical protein
MVDRQDIDALLVGALYGELTPADEARLAAHLESHPGDRAALDDLKSARQAVRESQIFEMQHEPPQAVSALLLQEAHRRAPKPARAQSQHEQEGWFSRLARSFFAHPAMAAAAMLVLVVGVASTIYLKKGGDEFASKESNGGAAPALATDDRAQAPAAAPAPVVAATPPSTGSGYNVGLADDNAALDQQVLQKEAEVDRGIAADKAEKKDAYKGKFAANQGGNEDGIVDGDRRRKESPPAHAAAKPPAVAVNTPSPALQPKDMDAPKALRDNAKAGRTYESQGGGGTATGATRDDSSLSAAAESSAPGGGAAAPSPPPPPPQKAPTRSALASAAPSQAAGPAPQAPKTSVTTKNDVKPTDPQTSWAQDQLAKAIAFAKNDNCKDAANAALAIRDKAPAFYKANVADNRDLKGCLPYMRNNVDQAEQRSKKSAPAKIDAESVK